MKNNLKNFIINILTTIGLISIVIYIFHNYENLLFDWWVIPTSLIVISLLNLFIPKFSKPLFCISLTGALIYFFYIIEEISQKLYITDSFIKFFTNFILIITLAILTEYLVADITLSNAILDSIIGAITIIIFNNVNMVIQEDFYIPLIRLIILLVYSITVVMVEKPSHIRDFKKD